MRFILGPIVSPFLVKSVPEQNVRSCECVGALISESFEVQSNAPSE